MNKCNVEIGKMKLKIPLVKCSHCIHGWGVCKECLKNSWEVNCVKAVIRHNQDVSGGESKRNHQMNVLNQYLNDQKNIP